MRFFSLNKSETYYNSQSLWVTIWGRGGVAEYNKTARTTKAPPKQAAKPSPNKARHAQKARPDTRVEKVYAEITTNHSRRPKGCKGKRYNRTQTSHIARGG